MYKVITIHQNNGQVIYAQINKPLLDEDRVKNVIIAKMMNFLKDNFKKKEKESSQRSIISIKKL